MGINQWDPSYFVHSDGTPTPGYRDFRGSFESSGQFNLSDKWGWGWDIVAPSDKTFFQDYNTGRLQTKDLIRNTPSEGVSQLYLTGRGDRSYFDARTMYFYGFSESDVQGQIPVVHPVIDYRVHLRPADPGRRARLQGQPDQPVARRRRSFDPITASRHQPATSARRTTADPAANTIPGNCVLRGFPGTYSRFSAEATWRRSITDPFGQVFTPFIYARGDVASLSVDQNAAVDNFLPEGDSNLVRAMPAVGLEYRYPFIGVQSWGTQTIEPIAQIVVRPNETQHRQASQRRRAKPDLRRQQPVQARQVLRLGPLGRRHARQRGHRIHRAGQQRRLLQRAVRPVLPADGRELLHPGRRDQYRSRLGLDKPRSDYIARFSYQPSRMYTFTSRFRFDEETWEVKRFELEGRVNFDRWSFTAIYGQYAAQPDLGFLTDREGVLGTSTFKLTTNWSVYGAIGYDLDQHKVDQTQLGVTYIDDCIAWALQYTTSYSYSGNPQEKTHAIMMTLGLRTLWDGQVSQKVDGLPGGFYADLPGV